MSLTQTVESWIRERAHPLICTHVRPDGDAYGSLFGLALALQSAGIQCSAYLSADIPKRYQDLLPQPRNLYFKTIPEPTYDSLICLDTATADRADTPADIDPENTLLPVLNIDHHQDNPRYGNIALIDSSKAATAALLIEVLDALPIKITPAVANCLLTGLIMDCGGFRFRNTDADALRAAARLLEAGGDIHTVMDRMFFQEPIGVLQLKAYLLEHAGFACNGHFIYAVMNADCRSRFAVRANETEGVIDILRSVEGTLIACLIQPQGNTVRLSLRGRDPAFPVDTIARQLGGGGHTLAAGAELTDTTVAQAQKIITDLVERTLNP